MMLPQLANTYSPAKNYGVAEWFSSPKLDGVRCLYENQTSGLRSRSGLTRYSGMTEIEEICESIRSTNNLSFIDGELYIPGTLFDVISGIVRSRKNVESVVANKQKVQFRIFAIGFNQYPTMLTFHELNQIKQIIPAMGKVSYIPHKLIENNPLVIQTEAEMVKSLGLSHEGIMLRSPNSIYSGIRSNNLLKVKNFVKNNFTVVGFTKGTGKYANSLGNLHIRGMINNQIINSRVGTGFTDLERSTIFANQADYLGRTLEVVYLGITATGSLRHPVFSGFARNY